MDTPTVTSDYDDGLYHPFLVTPVMLIPTSIATSSPDSAMSETPLQGVQAKLIASAKSSSPTTRVFGKSREIDSASVSDEAFTSIVTPSSITSANSPIPTADISPIEAHYVSKPPSVHHYVRDGLTALVVILVVLGLVGLTGFLTSQRFRRWRENRAARRLDSPWAISRPHYKEISFNPDLRKAPKDIPNPISIYSQTDPFARSIPRQNNDWSSFRVAQQTSTHPVEETDEERGWLWGTDVEKYDEDLLVTPGLGIGKYRSKYGKGGSREGREMRLSEPEGPEEMKEVTLYEEVLSSEELADRPTGPRQDPSRSLSSHGLSYLLTRLKESISGRSRFSTLGSSNGQCQMDPSRGQWNEVGQIMMQDKTDLTSPDEEERVARRDQNHSHLPLQRELSLLLADIALPELPPLSCDSNSTLKMTKTKRSRDPTMDVRDALSSSRSRRKELENTSHSGKYTHLPTPSSRSRRQRKEAGLTGCHRVDDLLKTRRMYPGGFVGRSPTKKLRRKACPEF